MNQTDRQTARRDIDRTTTHMCAGLAADVAYFQNQGRSYFRCEHSGETVNIPVQYAQFSMICADCRLECLDASDVRDATCGYCGEAI